MGVRDQITSAVEEDRVVIGLKESLKSIDDLDQVVVASNTPDDICEEVEDAADEAGAEFHLFEGTNETLGSLCGEPFAASTVGIKKVTNLK
jgi:ribosomal protein L30E